jgi:tRNA:m4X modification enzyme
MDAVSFRTSDSVPSVAAPCDIISTDNEITEEPPLPNGWTRCHAYNARKRRFCRQIRCTDSLYCGNHVHLTEKQENECKSASTVNDNHTGGDTDGASSIKSRKRRRIPCPLDPSHFIYAHRIQHHIAKCPKVKLQQQQEKETYYCYNINTGGHGSLHSKSTASSTTTTTMTTKSTMEHPDTSTAEHSNDTTVLRAHRLALAVLQTFHSLFLVESHHSEPCHPRSITYNQVRHALDLVDPSPQEIAAGLPDAIHAYRLRSGGPRHVHQQASLVGHLRTMGALPSTPHESSSLLQDPCVWMELGAGRGMTGLVAVGVAAAAAAPRSVPLILVERTGSRGKADTVLRQQQQQQPLPNDNDTIHKDAAGKHLPHSYMRFDTIQWCRVACDLAHVDMKSLLAEQQQEQLLKTAHTSTDNTDALPLRVMVVAKHLCGVGTDLALQSLLPIREHVQGCIFTTCCHGVCRWNDYVGRDTLRDMLHSTDVRVGVGAEEFDWMCRWSAGTVLTAKGGPGITRPVQTTTTESTSGENTIALNNTEAPPNFKDEEDDDGDDDLNHNRNDRLDYASDSLSIASIVESLHLECGVQGLGRACQRLIDYGRLQYIQQCLFSLDEAVHVKMLHYVPDTVTPQNAALIAYRK